MAGGGRVQMYRGVAEERRQWCFHHCGAFVKGSMPELGVGTAAQIHVALSSTNIGHDCDTCGSLVSGASTPFFP